MSWSVLQFTIKEAMGIHGNDPKILRHQATPEARA